MKRFASYFLQGLLYLVPIAATLYVIYVAVRYGVKFTHLLSQVTGTMIPGWISIVLIVVAIAFIGYISKMIIATPTAQFFDRLMKRMPIIRFVYSSVRDLMQAFVGKQRKFDSPVLVRISSDGSISRLGFITQNDLSQLGINNMISVYLPGSYGILGELIIVPKENVTPLNTNSAELMKFIVSGGITNVNDNAETAAELNAD
ncbi:MAG: DUF502 domain-containing protein [Bacteroidales bacterium]|nr:DUF502 domain-containing protein [Bacteroidales bacterium]